MPRIAVFADEIAHGVPEQVDAMVEEGIAAVELRSVDGVNVLDLNEHQCLDTRLRLADAGIEVFSIGSPVGKTPIADPVDKALDALRRAIDRAVFFGAPRIRVFSFYLDQTELDRWRPEVIARLTAMTELAQQADVVLCHENESGIYGQSIERCRDLLETIDSPHLRAVHDTSNWVVHGAEAYPAGYLAIEPWLEYVHVKDYGAGVVQPAGEGDGRMPDLFAALQRAGFDGYLSLEPHLGGGVENFRRAASALRRCLTALDWPWE